MRCIFTSSNNNKTYNDGIHSKTNRKRKEKLQRNGENANSCIKSNNGTNNSYFADYKGGTVSVVCNQDGETVYEEEVK